MGETPAQNAVGYVATRRDFADALATVRETAGLTVRELARAAGVPVATVGDYIAGNHLPPPRPRPVLADILNACGITDPAVLDQWWDALTRVRRPPGRRPAIAPVPYRGLASFRPEDVDWFHGREDLTRRLVAFVRRSGGGWRALVGPSGCGKSSLLGAGLVPALRGDGCSVVSLVPGSRPVEALYPLGRGDRGSGLVVIVDRFEDVFTDCADADRDAFIVALDRVARDAVVVLGMRTEFYPHASRHPLLARVLPDARVVVDPMVPAEARRAVTAPAIRAKVDIEDALVELLLRDLASTDGPTSLPLLSFALLETWRRSPRRRMTVAGYLAGGGVRGAVAQAAEDAYKYLSDAQQRAARQVFPRLIRLSAGADTCRRVDRADVHRPDLDPDDVDRVLDGFAEPGLITADRATAEITHETLLTAWPRLRTWIETDRVTHAPDR